MEISKEELEQLRAYRNISDEDDVRYKEIIKQKLLNNNKLIYLINNKELEAVEAENDEYFGVNILPYYLISPIQKEGMNYICYETSFDGVSRYNSVIKEQQVIFYVLCEQSNVVVRDFSVARHDLIAAELINTFQGKKDFGNQLKLVSSKPSTTDTNYATRTLIFEQLAPNSIDDHGRFIGGLRR